MKHLLILSACLLASPVVVAATSTAITATVEQKSLVQFDQPFLFAYGTWDKRAKVESGVARLSGDGLTNAGGAGFNVQLDLSAHAQSTLFADVRVGPANKAKVLRVLLRDTAGNSAMYGFAIDQVGQERTVVALTNGVSLDQPEGEPLEKPIDLSQITQVQLQGDWSGNMPMDIEVSKLYAATPDATLLEQRSKLVASKTAAREAKAKTREIALSKIAHTQDSPAVSRVDSIAPDLLAIHIAPQQRVETVAIPYVTQPGDEFVEGEHKALQVQDGKIVSAAEKIEVFRKINGQRTKIGLMVGSRVGPPMFKPAETLTGVPLETVAIEEPATYHITTPDGRAQTPVAVYRRSVATDNLAPGDQMPVAHTVYLKLPAPMQQGKTYTIQFKQLNTRQPSVEFTYDSRKNVSEAVHAIHTGYRSDDPFKRAFLSIWLGTGGAYTYTNVETFELLRADDRSVAFTGKIELVMAADAKEQLRDAKNHAKTAVYAMDFSAFNSPGKYVVHVPGVGTSLPFEIGENVWTDTFKKAMLGFLHQRSGMALGPPLTDYVRPRNLHPADGFTVYQSNISMPEAADGEGDWFPELQAAKTDVTLPQAWGGYADAGDFDRNTLHIEASYLHLELVELFPKTLGKLKLAVPTDEANDATPDLLNEVLWNMELFRRLQFADGGISGGVESSAHPRPGETSWDESLVQLAYAQDPQSSYSYAAAAAKLSRLLSPSDPSLSQAYSASARRAFDYAQQNETAFADRLNRTRSEYVTKTSSFRMLALVEMYHLTGDAKFHDVFKQEFIARPDQKFDTAVQQHAAFAYAKLPDSVATDAKLKADCKLLITNAADVAVKFGDGNVFGITTDIPSLPVIGFVGYYSTPGMITQSVPRAHALTGDAKYLAATVRACNYALGAGPSNMTYTTGVGHVYPNSPLHLDSRNSRQKPPTGLVITGQSDPSESWGFNDWVHTWKLGNNTVPGSRDWPASQAYVDLAVWPSMNELMLMQTMGRNSYWWGYLAGR
jgi:endoglucanase